MIRSLSLSEIKQRLNATLVNGDAQFSSLTIDTRQLQTGDLFVAIKGPNFDGHAFVEKAHLSGAVAAIVEQKASNRKRVVCLSWWLKTVAMHWAN